MRNLIFFACLALTSTCVDASMQRLYFFRIFFHNVCANPLNLITQYTGGTDSLNEILIKKELLDVGKSTVVVSAVSYYKDIEDVISDDYKLEISANGKTISLDKTQFLKILKKTDYSGEKCGFFCTSDTFSGTINDPALCP